MRFFRTINASIAYIVNTVYNKMNLIVRNTHTFSLVLDYQEKWPQLIWSINSRNDSYPAEVSPVQEVTQTLCPVPLDDSLAPTLLAELKQEGSELVTGLVNPSKPPVQDVNTCSGKPKKKHNSQHLWQQRQESSNTFWNDDGDGLERTTGQSARWRGRHHMPRGLLCAPPWSSQNRTGWSTPMGFPWLCTRLTDETNKASLLTPQRHTIVVSRGCVSPTWCVAPRLVVGGEDAQVATSHKVLIVHRQQRGGGRKELWVEDDLKEPKAQCEKWLLLQRSDFDTQWQWQNPGSKHWKFLLYTIWANSLQLSW